MEATTMANTSKQSPAKKKAAPKKAAQKPAQKPVEKPTKKVAPDFYALREAWMQSKEETTYWRRRLARANATQSSIADRQQQMDAANVELLKAHDAEKVADEAFTSAQKKARAKARR